MQMHLNPMVGLAALVLTFTAAVVAPETVAAVLTSEEVATAPAAAPAAPAYDDPDSETAAEPEPVTEVQPDPEPKEDGATKRREAPAEQEQTAPVEQPPVEQPPVVLPPEFLEAVEAESQTVARGVAAGPFSFGLTSFNILGSNHTKPGADKENFAPGTLRTEWAVSYLENVPNDVIGFSEIQRDQLSTFMRATGNAYDAWPGEALGGVGVPQTMVWRKSMFTATEKLSITIPFLGQQRPQPVVRLRHLETGREFWVINVHNAPRDREAERDQAQALEVAMIKKLRESGLPVFFIGDMNDKAEIFCVVTGQTDLYAPLGGSNDGVCRPPKGMRVDWIFGSSDVDFTSFKDDKSNTVRRITDHAVLLSRVTIP